MLKIYKIIEDLKSKYKSNIVFDTRLIKKNDIFIGLKTKNNDGSLYYNEAIKKKAALVIVNIYITHPKLLYVKDTHLFIKNFCKFILASYKGKIIAVTGSVGKTTFKENIFHILKNNYISAYRSYKNFNNIQGLQFSIMNMNLKSKYSVYEIGINNPKEMLKLVNTLQPHYCLVTGIENSHIGNFRNFRHLVDNKLKIFKSKRLISGLVNYNYEAHYINNKLNHKVDLINSEKLEKNIISNKEKYTVNFIYNKRKYSIESSRGEFYINIAIISFLFIKKFIKTIKFKTFFYDESIIESRGKKVLTFIGSKKINFYDHSYNASPYSLNKQILIFNKRNIKQKAYILGSMKELGSQSDFFHMQIIELVTKLNLRKIIFIGDEFYKFKKKFDKFIFYKNYMPAINYLNTEFLFNLFGYISFRSGLSLVTSFLIVLILMPHWVRIQKYAFPSGQPIRNDGPDTHYRKKGTPTLGGVLILFSIILSSILWTSNFSSFNYILILTLILFGLIGFFDDFQKVKLGKGITSKIKFLLQLFATLVIYFTIKYNGFDLNQFSIPFLKNVSIELGYFYFVLILVIVIGSTNATNLTDGLDGLVSMPLIFVFLTFAVFAYVLGNMNFSDYLLVNYIIGSGEIVIFCTSAIGALLGFLWFNSSPASIFMGDTGSQSLGASLAVTSILLKQEIVLAVAGGLFVIETLSVMIQVTYFKFSKGKRVFLMAPLHHHYEKKGLSEQKIVIRFWILSFLFCLLALSLLKIR